MLKLFARKKDGGKISLKSGLGFENSKDENFKIIKLFEEFRNWKKIF